MKQTIFFDLDDTLIHCNRYFDYIIDQFASLMVDMFRPYGLTDGAVREKQTEIDIAGVQIVGFQSDHFPQSFVETYRYFADAFGRSRSKFEEESIWKLGISVYELDAEPYPNMEETLKILSESGHDLHLYTGGEPLIQRKKIDRFALDRYFGNRIYIRRHKNIEAFESILQSVGADRARTWMIGNSLRTDVIPALTAGIHAIHMQAETEWAYNVVNVDVAPQGAFLQLNGLSEIPSAIEAYVLQRR